MFLWGVIIFLFNSSKGEAIPVLLFKSARSGSSWMTSLINQYEGVYLTEEILSFHKKQLSQKDIWLNAQQYLMNAFSSPMPKYGSSNKAPNKSKAFDILGATLHPLNGGYILNFSEVAERIPHLRLVVYSRTNIIKHAVGIIHGKMLQSKCGVLVLNGTQCNVADSFRVKISNLNEYIIRAIALDDYLFRTVRRIAPLLENWFYYFSYEELISDPQRVIERLLDWVVHEDKVRWSRDMEGTNSGRCSNNCTKLTSDDLRDVILNFDEVESFIKARYPCLLRHLYERRPDAVMIPVHESCREDLFPGEEDFINEKVEMFKSYKKRAFSVI